MHTTGLIFLLNAMIVSLETLISVPYAVETPLPTEGATWTHSEYGTWGGNLNLTAMAILNPSAYLRITERASED